MNDPMIEPLFHNNGGVGDYIAQYREQINHQAGIVVKKALTHDVTVGVDLADLCMYMFQLGRKYELDYESN